jgi:GT2 family glycosyltransferase
VRVTTRLTKLADACGLHGLAAGQLTWADGTPQSGFTIRRFPTPVTLVLETLGVNRIWRNNPWNRRYRYLDRDLDQDGPVEQPAGAFLMTRRDVWEQLGGLDEDFHPIWFEDVDFCRRAALAGVPIQYLASVKATHLGGQSVKKLDASMRELYWYVSLIKYAAKHFPVGPVRWVCGAVMISTVPRVILGMIRERGFRPVTSGFKILSFAGRRLVSSLHRSGRDLQT